MGNNAQDIYYAIFKEYPDVMDVKQVSKLLGVSTKTVYGLIKKGSLLGVRVGREFRVPKLSLMKYMKIFGSSTAAQTI